MAGLFNGPGADVDLTSGLLAIPVNSQINVYTLDAVKLLTVLHHHHASVVAVCFAVRQKVNMPIPYAGLLFMKPLLNRCTGVLVLSVCIVNLGRIEFGVYVIGCGTPGLRYIGAQLCRTIALTGVPCPAVRSY